MIFFRTDGNEKIGLGHVMRCLSIAEVCKSKEIEIRFVLSDTKCQEIIENKGFECSVLGTCYNDMESELNSFCELIAHFKPQTIVIDSYYVTYNYLYTIREKANTVYIDDVLAFAYPVDVLINYNIFSSLEDYLELYKSSECFPKFLLGTKYVPLRSEFSNCVYKEPSKKVKKILVSTGGSDPEHVGINLLKYIGDNLNLLSTFNFIFVIGSVNKDVSRIKELANNIPNVHIIVDAKNMQEIMNSCDLAVSAAGSTLYELCVTCVPTITYVLADNQLPAAKAFSEQGLMEFIGDIRSIKNYCELILKAIFDLSNDSFKRKSMCKKSYTQINKIGAKTISNSICYF